MSSDVVKNTLPVTAGTQVARFASGAARVVLEVPLQKLSPRMIALYCAKSAVVMAAHWAAVTTSLSRPSDCAAVASLNDAPDANEVSMMSTLPLTACEGFAAPNT